MYKTNGEMSVYFRRITMIFLMIILLYPACKCWKLPVLPKNVTELIRGGEPAALGEFPYQIAFKERLKKDSKTFYTFCGGSIIGEAKILSAAHCFVDEEIKFCTGHQTHARSFAGKYAVAGTVRNIVYIRKGIEDDGVSQWRGLQNIVYPKHYFYPHHDIAILFVVTPFKYDDYVKPIRIAERFVDYEGLSLVSGYGQIGYKIQSDSLLKAYLFTFPNKECSRNNPSIDMDIMICTSVQVADIAKGDSGGPLVRSNNYGDKNSRTLIGVACGTYEGRNSLFTRVSAYRDFIRAAKNHCEEDTSFYYLIVQTFIVLLYTFI